MARFWGPVGLAKPRQAMARRGIAFENFMVKGEGSVARREAGAKRGIQVQKRID